MPTMIQELLPGDFPTVSSWLVHILKAQELRLLLARVSAARCLALFALRDCEFCESNRSDVRPVRISRLLEDGGGLA